MHTPKDYFFTPREPSEPDHKIHATRWNDSGKVKNRSNNNKKHQRY